MAVATKDVRPYHVYVPGVGGIRIEDDVAVHASNTEVLTRIPRDLIEI